MSLIRASRFLSRRYGHGSQRFFFSASDLTIQQQRDTAKFDARPANQDLVFGKTFTDHMFMVNYNQDSWAKPRIVPYANLSLSPAASSLHYGLQCFEGMKAYRSLSDDDNKSDVIRLFRPYKNMERLSNSMKRLSMPGNDFDKDEFVKCIARFVALDAKWIPSGLGYALYLRPTAIATTPYLGVTPPKELLLYVIASPVGPYYRTNKSNSDKNSDSNSSSSSSSNNDKDAVPLKSVALTCDTPFVRAWPGGTGASKIGGNYGPTMPAHQQATKDGYAQNLWLLDDYVTEVGAMNVFFVVKPKDNSGMLELWTPPLSRGDILPGVTRDSILYLARERYSDSITVCEQDFTMTKVKQAADEDRLVEAFGAGTAAVVTPIDKIQYQGANVVTQQSIGDFTKRVWRDLVDIQYGQAEAPKGWIVSVDPDGNVIMD